MTTASFVRPALVTAFLSLAICVPVRAETGCTADLNGDGVVSGSDLGALLGNWGQPGIGDLNGDGVVGGADLGIILGAWGACVTVPPWATLIDAEPDPAVVTDPTLRAAIRATGYAWRVKDTATQVEMLLVPPGTFQMGCSAGTTTSACLVAELPVHTVTLAAPFYLGRYELTQSQWTARIGSNPSYFQGASYPDAPSRPVEQVSWDDASRFMVATGFRFPTEAEWEYACRAGTPTPFYNGSNDEATATSLAWASANSSAQTHARGGRQANALGLSDMAGNTWEWVGDWSGNYGSAAQTDPTGPSSGQFRVFRGGAYNTVAAAVRSSFRSSGATTFKSTSIGFRVARSP